MIHANKKRLAVIHPWWPNLLQTILIESCATTDTNPHSAAVQGLIFAGARSNSGLEIWDLCHFILQLRPVSPHLGAFFTSYLRGALAQHCARQPNDKTPPLHMQWAHIQLLQIGSGFVSR